ncbi:MAG: hypothetical protein P0S94_03105 [Simkaniaceae bacterium]|nr:hypothetical protein [Simkaniaceae bacterium]
MTQNLTFDCYYYPPSRRNEHQPPTTGSFTLNMPTNDRWPKIEAVYTLFEEHTAYNNCLFCLAIPLNTHTWKEGLKTTLAPFSSHYARFNLNSITRIAKFAIAVIIDLITIPLRLLSLIPRLIYQHTLPDPMTKLEDSTFANQTTSVTITWNQHLAPSNASSGELYNPTVFDSHRGILLMTNHTGTGKINRIPRSYYLGA